MRWLVLVAFVLVAGCGDDSSSSSAIDMQARIDMQAPVVGELAVSVCPRTLDALCANNSYCDNRYVNGMLVAVFDIGYDAAHTESCSFGPPTFAVPTGCDAGTPSC